MSINKENGGNFPQENRDKNNLPELKDYKSPSFDNLSQEAAFAPKDDVAQDIFSGDQPPTTAASAHNDSQETVSFIPHQQEDVGQRVKIPMQHRNPDPECPLCPVSGPPVDPRDPNALEIAHQDALLLWNEWDPNDPGKEWVLRVIEVARQMGITVSEEEVEEHFSEKHRIEQPALPGQITSESFMEVARDTLPREQEVILALYRHRVLTTPQITEVFYRERGKKQQAAKKKAQGDLKNLAQKHLLFRYFPSEEDIALPARPPQFAKLALWYPAKRAVPFIIDAYNLNPRFPVPYANGASTISNEIMMHDLRASDVFVSLARKINDEEGKFDTEWGRITIDYDPSNWYGPGPRSLSIGFQDPSTLMWVRMKPDGFATLSIERSRQLKKSLMPFWIEYDRGTKDVKDVAEQLFSYHLLALSGAAGKRFPDLAAENYAIPVIAVFFDKKQMLAVQKKLMDIAKEVGIQRGAPIFLALDKDWRKDPFAEETTMHAWSGERGSFLSYLIKSSQPLHEQRALTPGQTLTLDLGGAPYRAEGAMSESGKAEGREAIERKREEAEERERKESIKASLERMKREAQERAGITERAEQVATETSIPESAKTSEESIPINEEQPTAESVPETVTENKTPEESPAPESVIETVTNEESAPRPSFTPEPSAESATEPTEPSIPEPILQEPTEPSIPEPILQEPTEPFTPEPILQEPMDPFIPEPVPSGEVSPAIGAAAVNKIPEEKSESSYDPNDPFAPRQPEPPLRTQLEDPKDTAPESPSIPQSITDDEVIRLREELARVKAELAEKEKKGEMSILEDRSKVENPLEKTTLEDSASEMGASEKPEAQPQEKVIESEIIIGDLGLDDSIDIPSSKPSPSEETEEKDAYIPAYESHRTYSGNEEIDLSASIPTFPDLEAEIKSATSPSPMLQTPPPSPVISEQAKPAESKSPVPENEQKPEGVIDNLADDENIEEFMSKEAASRRAKRNRRV